MTFVYNNSTKTIKSTFFKFFHGQVGAGRDIDQDAACARKVDVFQQEEIEMVNPTQG